MSRAVPRTAADVLERRFVSYQAPLELARRWARSGDLEHVAEAVALLPGLLEERHFPWQVEIGHELVFALTEQAALRGAPQGFGEARHEFDQVSSWATDPSEELLARSGKLYKAKGDQSFLRPGETSSSAADRRIAAHYYELALGEYSRAYAIRRGHFPGINVACLQLLLAALRGDRAPAGDAAKPLHEQTAEALLASREQWPLVSEADEVVWAPATQGEACLLLQRWEEAREWYASAIASALCDAHSRQTMREQTQRVVRAFKMLEPPVRAAFDPAAVFGDASTKAPAPPPPGDA